MKKAKLILMLMVVSFFTIFTTSCSKEEGCTDVTATNYNGEADEDDGSCTFNGKVTFWQYSGDAFASTSVTLNGLTKNITADITTTSGPSSCTASSGSANFEFPTGTYSYTATETTSSTPTTWSGNITIEKNGCLSFRLK